MDRNKHRTKQEKINLCLKIASLLVEQPLQTTALSNKLGMARSEYLHFIDRMVLYKIITKSKSANGNFVWSLSNGMPTLDQIEKSFVRRKRFDDGSEDKTKRTRFVGDPRTTRRCRTCNKFLTASRYFTCLECVGVLDLVNDDFIYSGPMVEDSQDLDEDAGDFFEQDIAELAATIPNEEQNE